MQDASFSYCVVLWEQSGSIKINQSYTTDSRYRPKHSVMFSKFNVGSTWKFNMIWMQQALTALSTFPAGQNVQRCQ